MREDDGGRLHAIAADASMGVADVESVTYLLAQVRTLQEENEWLIEQAAARIRRRRGGPEHGRYSADFGRTFHDTARDALLAEMFAALSSKTETAE